MSTFCPGCGRRLLNDWCSWCAEHIREPQIGRFEVKAVLGSGQLGTLLLARDPHLSRNVAIRTVGSGVPNADWVDQYIAVVRQTARLPHPNCVDIYSVLTNLHEPAVVMEYVQGGTLEAVWRAARAATSPVSVQALQQILGVLRGLAFLHENGLVHGRVRAQNVLTHSKRRIAPRGWCCGNGRQLDPPIRDLGRSSVLHCSSMPLCGQALRRWPGYWRPRCSATGSPRCDWRSRFRSMDSSEMSRPTSRAKQQLQIWSLQLRTRRGSHRYPEP
jgi:serine/threonine protein kinase